jgi:CDP-diacylglycerol--glycerol-3-phosphate 3-phosphatidyltransferase
LTLANRITLLRIALIPLCIIFLLADLLGLAAVIFLFLSLSDLLDGYIARKYHQVSEIGKMLDPLADKILVISVLVGLSSLGKADPLAVILICAREIIVSSLRSDKIFPASPVAKWKTVAQVAAVLMLMLGLPLANALLWLAVILSLFSGGMYVWQSRIFEQLKSS